MGGANSEIQDTTSNILLESAYFNPSAIRKTAKRLGLHTESSHRFERGADIEIVTRALERAASLIAELAGGEVAKGIIDVYPRRNVPRSIRFSVTRCNELLGITLSSDEIAELFRRLEFTVEATGQDVLDVRVPTYRVDLEREIDLVEEVARLNGYDRIPVTIPRAGIFSDRPTRHQRLERCLRDLMVGHGFNEVINFSFMAPASLDKLLLDTADHRRSPVRLRNPLVEEQSVMRTTLLPGLLETAAGNISYRSLDLRLFELRRVYLPEEGKDLPNEPLYLAGILAGLRVPEGWNQERRQVDFYDAKGVVENILETVGIAPLEFSVERLDPFYHPGKACAVKHGGEIIGSLGEIHPDVQQNFDLSLPIYYFELNFEKLVALGREDLTVTPPSRFPDTFRDIAMLVDEETLASVILEGIEGLRIKEIESAAIFDLYRGTSIPEGKKSIAVRVRYRSHEKTLTDDDVTSLHQRVIDNLVRKLNATMR
jgi:phenylalanyl-tRNA synthetase beta chain